MSLINVKTSPHAVCDRKVKVWGETRGAHHRGAAALAARHSLVSGLSRLRDTLRDSMRNTGTHVNTRDVGDTSLQGIH